MLRFGTAGIPISTPRRSTLEGVKQINKLSLDALEVQFVRGVRMSEESAKKVGKIANELDVMLSTHAPYFINFASEKESTRKRSGELVVETAKVAELMGAKLVVFHPGYYSKSLNTTRLMREGIAMVNERVKDNGWRVVLAPETMGRQATFGTLEEILGLCKEVDAVPALDFAHLHARCNGCLRRKEDFGKILSEVVKKLKINDLHIHFTGVEYKNGNEKKHLMLEEGDLDFSRLATALLERNLSATIISESPNLEADALLMQEMAK